MLKSRLKEFDLTNKTVLVRTDWNVPLDNFNAIADDHKLNASLKTLQFIKAHGAKIIIITHWGQPKNNESCYSTKQFLPWLFNQGFTSCFAQTIQEVASLKKHDSSHNIIVLENIRFFKEEQTNDLNFAQSLKNLADYFVQDAFGALHRSDTSLTTLPSLFDQDKKTIGFLVEQELKVLEKFTTTIEHPFVLIVGGNKMNTKLPLIEHFINKADYIIVLPALAFTFLKALHKEVGNSLTEEPLIIKAQNIINALKHTKTKLIMPIDFRVTEGTFNQPNNSFIIKNFDEKAHKNLTGISMGPETIALIKPIISSAKTLFFNGPCANINYPETTLELKDLLTALTKTSATKLFAGGDSCAVFAKLGFQDFINHHPENFSTGGGATLEYLTGTDLAGLQSLD